MLEKWRCEPLKIISWELEQFVIITMFHIFRYVTDYDPVFLKLHEWEGRPQFPKK